MPNFLSLSTFRFLGVLAAIGFAGCNAKNLYPDLRPDPEVMIRQWTRPSYLLDRDAGRRGNEFSNPIVWENTVVFGNQGSGLVALYPGMNQVRWVLPIKNGVSSELFVNRGSVYFGGGDGYVYSVDLETGRVNWRYLVRTSSVSLPVIHRGVLFVTTSDDTVYSLNAKTGEWIWHYRRRSTPTATIFGAAAPLVVGNQVLAGLSDGFLVALSFKDGKLNWEKRLHEGRKFIDLNANPVAKDGLIYVPTYDGHLFALSDGGKKVRWKFESGGGRPVTIDGERLYLPSSDGTIYALNRKSAKLLWKFELDHGVATQIAVSKKYLFFGSSFRYLYVLDKITGRPVYRYDGSKGNGFWGSPLYHKKRKPAFHSLWKRKSLFVSRERRGKEKKTL